MWRPLIGEAEHAHGYAGMKDMGFTKSAVNEARTWGM
jgi:hypothetical protein